MSKSWIVPVGGFLGAGKTTLILAAAQLLKQKGLKAAAILNDQGAELVDTAYARANDLSSTEVTGGCFCCRFSDFIDAAEELRRYAPDVIFAEPVGSCTDLSATILQPLKSGFLDRYQLAPLTVLVDPARAQSARDPNVDFLFERQIAEADLIAFTKCDMHSDFPSLPGKNIRYLSARSGQGVAAWLDEIFSGAIPVGREILDIDYQEYARAEAALAWLNWSATLRLAEMQTPAQLVGPLLDSLQEALTDIAHLKILDQTPHSYIKAAVTTSEEDPSIEGDLLAEPESEHKIYLNLRAVLPASDLEALFRNIVSRLPGERIEERLECFSPAPPKPEHRYSQVAGV